MATKDLGAKALLLSHAGRFSIARHTWDDPFLRIIKAAKGMPYSLLTPALASLFALVIQNSVLRRGGKTFL